MCVRTKTSHGCGHVYKSTADCYSSACSGIERYHYLKEGDCRDCKSEGSNTSRGRDGKGRYAQSLKKSSKTRDRTASPSNDTLLADCDVTGGKSPWAPEVGEEKTWESPHRRQADKAWVSEHKHRISDLQERMEKFSLSEEASQPSYTKEIVLASDYYDNDEYDQSDSDSVPETPTMKSLGRDNRQRLDDRAERSRSYRHQDRQHSHDSLPDSMPSYRSSPKLRKLSAMNVVHAYPEASYEYDYYNNTPTYAPPKHYRRHHHPGASRSKTDPYNCHRTYRPDSDYDITPGPPPLQIPPPAPAVYDTCEYYSPHASPSGAPYIYPEYPYELSSLPLPRPQHYVGYRRY